MANSITKKSVKNNLIIIGHVISLVNTIGLYYAVIYLIRRKLFIKAVRREIKEVAEGRLRYAAHLYSSQYKRARERYGINYKTIPKAWRQFDFWERQPDFDPSYTVQV